jgi:hypothetical protein
MSPRTEEHLTSYLRSLSTLEPQPTQITALQAAARARPLRRLRVRNTLALAVVIVAGSSTLATATGIVSLPGMNPDPLPPARVVENPVPADARGLFGVLRTPALTGHRAAVARSVVTQALRAPFVIDPGSIRSVGATPLAAPAFVAYARMDRSQMGPAERRAFPDGLEGIVVAVEGASTEGPYPLDDVRRGVAWGVQEVGDGALMTAILPDGVASIRITMDDGTRVSASVHRNVAFAHLNTAADTSVNELRWIDEAGEAIKTLDF